MPTKTNGYYCLEDGLMEELKYGIQNYDYGTFHKPIINGYLKIKLSYKDSSKEYGIQVADIIANTIRRSIVLNNNWFDTKKYLKGNRR